MDYAAIAKKFGGAQAQEQPAQSPGWMSELSPKDQASLRMESIQGAKKRIAELDAEIAKAEPILRDLERFGALNRDTATGSLWQNLGPSAPMFHGNDTQEMMAIQNRLGPSQRAVGSGASSDRDVQLFLSGIPGIDKKGGVNKNIREQFKTQYDYAVRKKTMMQNYLQQNGSLDGFDQAWSNANKSAGRQQPAGVRFLGFEEE